MTTHQLSLDPTLLAAHYPVMEHFYTLQGEGAFSGRASYFIRLGGCDVGCVWCDVKESWPLNAHPRSTVQDLLTSVTASGAPIAVITGGEPCMHNLDALTTALLQAGVRTHIETSGAHPASGILDWICLSPKKFKAPLPEWYALAHELKVVVYNKTDLAWAEEHARKCNSACELFLQPEWSKHHQIEPIIIEYIKNNPKWRLSLQTHKYLDIP